MSSMAKLAVSACFGASVVGLQVHNDGLQMQSDCSMSQVKSDFEWVEENSTKNWEINVVNGKQSCTLQKGSTSAPLRIVVDYNGQNLNDNTCCASDDVWAAITNRGYVCTKSAIDGSQSDTIQLKATNEDGPARHVQYEYAMPTACKKGGSKAPCPLLLSLPGTNGLASTKCVVGDQTCVDEQGVILLTPMQDDGAEHEDTSGFDYEHARFCYWEDARQLKSLVETFASEHEGSVDTNRVMLFGQSSGGTAAMWGAIRSPDVFSHVYAVSPKSFWRPGAIKGCNQSGLQPTNDYDDFLTHSKPLWEKRSKEGTRKLQRLVVFMGSEDLHNGNPDGDTAWDVIPNIITDLKMAETGVRTEFRVYVGLEHRTDAAAFNEGYDFLWKGEQQDDDGWASGTVV